MSQLIALIPAAGKSVRMGRPKLLLPLGDRTVLERVISAFTQAGVDRVLVVTPPDLPELAAVARSVGAEAVELPQQTQDMRATVQFGLDWIEKHWSPAPDEAWFLAPADHPVLAPEVVRQLAQAKEQHPGHSIFVPTHDGRRGHPALFGWNQVAAIRAFPAEQGLNAYVRGQGEKTLEVPVSVAGALVDLDTPEEYAALCAAQAHVDSERIA